MKKPYEIPVLLDPATMQRDMRHRLKLFNDWLRSTKTAWYEVDLVAFGNYLRQANDLTAATVLAPVSTIKARFRDLALSGQLDALLTEALPEGDGREMRMRAAIDVVHAAASFDTRYLSVERMPDITYPTTAQLNELFRQPDVKTVSGLRDVTILGLLYCTGMNETELCNLTMEAIEPIAEESDWRIFVGETAGGQAREVTVYDATLFDQRWLARYVKALRRETDVRSGSVFRGLRRDGKSLRPGGLTPRAVRQILKAYSVMSESGTQVTFTALYLRRTFARRLYLAGVAFDDIQANLGHGSNTTREYIGPPQISPLKYDLSPITSTQLLQQLASSKP